MAEGYEVSALHYLLKPVKEAKLHEVLDKAHARLSKAERVLFAEAGGGQVRIPVRGILYAEAMAHHVMVVTTSGAFELRKSFSELEKELGPQQFVRCHRSYLVGLSHVKRLTKTDVILENDTMIPLARRQYDAVHQAFINHYKVHDPWA